MKLINKIAILVLAGFMLMATNGCKRVIEEQNRSQILPDYFKTDGGVEAAMAGAYSHIRNLYNTEGTAYLTMTGTDDAVRGFGTSTNLITYTQQTDDGNVAGFWNVCYEGINNCNGVIEFAPNTNILAANKQRLIGEAKFLRGWFYFMLVQTFGDVTLSTKFVTEPSTAATRDPISAVYDQIIKDLTEAVAELPNKAVPSPGRAAKGAALHLLSKVYLTRGWSSAAKATDFTDAYNTANKLITEKSQYGNNNASVDLEQDFKRIFIEGNEYGKEILWVIDRNTNPVGSETPSYGTGNPGAKHNGAAFYHRPNYPTFNVNVNQGITGAPEVKVNPIDRDVANGRPFGRIRPSNYTLDVAFAERTNDSRYEKTFQTFYIFNRPGPLSAQTPVNITVTRATNFNDPMGSALTTYTWVKGVDTSVKLAGTNAVTEAQRRASKSVMITPSQYTVDFFPPMTKYDDSTKLHTNDASDRPFIMMRFGETYLIAAEAAFKAGKPADAAAMINVLRTRAAFRTTNTPAENAAAAAAMQITAADINIDFIMDERTRELYGEWMRWYDLARTKTLASRIATYNPVAAFDPNKHYLRPIPQTQINLVTTGPKYPQNPGY